MPYRHKGVIPAPVAGRNPCYNVTLSTTSNTPLLIFGSPLSSIFSPQITMPIPIPIVSQPVPLVIVLEVETPTEEEIEYFGDDAVVSLGEYFWSRSERM